MKYFTADLHNKMPSIIKFCDRPFKNADEMAMTVRANWINTVHEDDEIYVLGDVCDPVILDALPGKLSVIMGNHDNYESIKKVRPDAMIYPHPVIIERYIILSHNPIIQGVKDQDYFLNIHGHIHCNEVNTNTWWCGCRWYNCGVDTNNFTPVSLSIIRNKLGMYADCE